MNVIMFVAAITFDRCLFIVIGYMALFAGHDGMQADQRKAGNVMIEPDFRPPAFFIVAIVAIFTLFTLMDIIDPVTTVTICF
jgi:hypothetical protein